MDTGQRTAGRFYDMTNPVNTGFLQIYTVTSLSHFFQITREKKNFFEKWF